MLSIIVPVRNESNIINEVFDYFLNNLKDIKYEVLIINDFSDDDDPYTVSSPEHVLSKL